MDFNGFDPYSIKLKRGGENEFDFSTSFGGFLLSSASQN